MKKQKMKIIIPLLIIFVITLPSCEKEEGVKISENVKYTVDSQRYLDASKSNFGDPFEIDNVLKEENMLYINVNYGGGCKEHSFEVIWASDFIKTNPPSIGIVLVHDANNDMCELICQIN